MNTLYVVVVVWFGDVYVPLVIIYFQVIREKLRAPQLFRVVECLLIILIMQETIFGMLADFGLLDGGEGDILSTETRSLSEFIFFK